MVEKDILIDGAGGVLGRLAAFAAKQALRGNKVLIFNCNNVIISGTKSNIMARYNEKRARGSDAQKGPYIPRQPKDLFKRTIRGMLQYKKVQGMKAYRRITTFADVPQQYVAQKKLTFKRDVHKHITLLELSRLI